MCTYAEERAARSSTMIICKPTIHVGGGVVFALDVQRCDHTTSRLEFVCGHWSNSVHLPRIKDHKNVLGHNQ